jgi:excisionase family DNA binding protein
MDDRGAFTIPEFCAWSRIGRTKVYELIAAGDLPIVKIGKKTLVRFSDGQALLNKFLASDAGASPRKEGGA